MSLRSHQYRKRQLDEFLILADRIQGAAHIVGDIGSSLLFDLVGQFQDGGLKGQLVFVDLVEQGREQV